LLPPQLGAQQASKGKTVTHENGAGLAVGVGNDVGIGVAVGVEVCGVAVCGGVAVDERVWVWESKFNAHTIH
jgi:hypothetical protein